MARTKNEIKKELKTITDTVNVEVVNKCMEPYVHNGFELSKKTLENIAKWALDGKTQVEIAKNLELTQREWEYLCKICPTILQVMSHSQAYAELMVIGSLYQTAIGGHTIKKRVPMKVKDYGKDKFGKVVPIGEHIEMVEYEEVQPSNPYLLKWLAERKLSENFGENKRDTSIEHREIIDQMSEEERKALETYGVK